jgi:hypothetical protein
MQKKDVIIKGDMLGRYDMYGVILREEMFGSYEV